MEWDIARHDAYQQIASSIGEVEDEIEVEAESGDSFLHHQGSSLSSQQVFCSESSSSIDVPTSSQLKGFFTPETKRRKNDHWKLVRLSEAERDQDNSGIVCVILDALSLAEDQHECFVGDESAKHVQITLLGRFTAGWGRKYVLPGNCVFFKDVFFREDPVSGLLRGFVHSHRLCACLLERGRHSGDADRKDDGSSIRRIVARGMPQQQVMSAFEKLQSLDIKVATRQQSPKRSDENQGMHFTPLFDATAENKWGSVLHVRGRISDCKIASTRWKNRLMDVELTDTNGLKSTLVKIHLWREFASDSHLKFLRNLMERKVLVSFTHLRVTAFSTMNEFFLNQTIHTQVKECFQNTEILEPHAPRKKAIRIRSLEALLEKGLRDVNVQVPACIRHVETLKITIYCKTCQSEVQSDKTNVFDCTACSLKEKCETMAKVESFGDLNAREFSSVALEALDDYRQMKYFEAKLRPFDIIIADTRDDETQELNLTIPPETAPELLFNLPLETLLNNKLQSMLKRVLCAASNPKFLFTFSFQRDFDENSFPIADSDSANLLQLKMIPLF